MQYYSRMLNGPLTLIVSLLANWFIWRCNNCLRHILKRAETTPLYAGTTSSGFVLITGTASLPFLSTELNSEVSVQLPDVCSASTAGERAPLDLMVGKEFSQGASLGLNNSPSFPEALTVQLAEAKLFDVPQEGFFTSASGWPLFDSCSPVSLHPSVLVCSFSDSDPSKRQEPGLFLVKFSRSWWVSSQLSSSSLL